MKENKLIENLVVFGIISVISISFFSFFRPSSSPERILFFLSSLIVIGSVAGFTVTLVKLEREEEKKGEENKKENEKEKKNEKK